MSSSGSQVSPAVVAAAVSEQLPALLDATVVRDSQVPGLVTPLTRATLRERNVAATLGDATLKRNQNAPVPMTVVIRAHSLGYGQDTTPTGTVAPANGSDLARNPQRPPASMKLALDNLIPGVTVVDQTFPGDRAEHGLTRWAGQTYGDAIVLWYETNEAVTNASITTYKAAMQQMIDEATAAGSVPILVGGAPTQYPGTTNRKLRSYASATAQLAARNGLTYVDVAELFQANPVGGNVWADGDNIHLSTAGYALVGIKLAALLGPYGVSMPKVAPGTTLYPIQGGAYGGALVPRTTERSGALVQRLTAGQVASYPVQVTAPCTVLVDFRSSDDGNGVGTGALNYGYNVAGETTRGVNVATHTAGKTTTVRGHTLRGHGPELVLISCGAGSLEVERIRFVAADTFVSPGASDLSANGRRAHPSALRGTVVGPIRTGSGLGADAIFDDQCPLGGGQTSSNDTDDVDLSVRLPAGASTFLALASSLDRAAASLIGTGYSLRRNNADLMVYENTSSTTNALLTTIPGVFPAAGVWEGVVQWRIAGNLTITVAIDGTDVHSIVGAKWAHYIPGAWTTGSSLTIQACTVRRRTRG